MPRNIEVLVGPRALACVVQQCPQCQVAVLMLAEGDQLVGCADHIPATQEE